MLILVSTSANPSCWPKPPTSGCAALPFLGKRFPPAIHDGTIKRPDGKNMRKNDAPTLESPLTQPTRARFVVLGFLCSMALILYLDRVCIQQALVPMQDEFGWSNTQASLVMVAFTLAYGIFEIPTGRLGDLYGSRGVLTRIVL